MHAVGVFKHHAVTCWLLMY